MIFLTRYIYSIISENIAKVLVMLAGFIFLYIAFNHVDKYYKDEEIVLTTFEVNTEKYLVIYDGGNTDGFRSVKMSDGYTLGDDGSKVVHEGFGGYYLWFSIVGWALISIPFTLGLFVHDYDYDYRWRVKDIYYNCLVRRVKFDREGSEFLYHYKGRLLARYKTEDNSMYIGKGLSSSVIKDKLKEFKKSPNLY